MPEQLELPSAVPAATEAAVVTSTPEDTMAQVFDKFNPQERVTRADNGKFASKEPTEAKTEIPAEGAETAEPAETESTKEPVAETAEPAKPVIARPQSWSADLDAKWASLSPDLQEFIAKRESEAHAKISQQGEAVKIAEHFRPHMEPLARIAAQVRAPVGEVLNRFLAADDYLRRDPVAAIQWLANSYGVDLSGYANAQTDPADPVRPLLQKIAGLEQRLNENTQHLVTREQQQFAERASALTRQVEDFAKDKDYWQDIESEMVSQVQILRNQYPEKSSQEILKDAHDRAVKLNDAVHEKLTKAQREADAKKKAEDDKRKAEAARKAAQLNVKSTASSP